MPITYGTEIRDNEIFVFLAENDDDAKKQYSELVESYGVVDIFELDENYNVVRTFQIETYPSLAINDINEKKEKKTK